jgi:hypothetical protein
MGFVVGAKAVATTETAVHFSTPSEAPAARGAGLRRGGGGQDVVSACGVTELPGRVGKVFFSEKLQAASQDRLPLSDRCIATGDWRILQYLPEAIREFCSQFHNDGVLVLLFAGGCASG